MCGQQQESTFKSYQPETRVMIKSTNEHGEVYESALGYVSVFIDGEEKARIFKEDDVIFLDL